ncbi:hypothetical protein GGQ22_13225 [Nocardioides sp. zg-579]|uniref:Uncharacterized protein n=1 Tax=Nocardioides marmotae TaxID=2663857 RepID=A0A6I3JD20_9ACTN|nr:hypothetical protein [Nocardioides marmotae]MTB96044.1 hypothetical protein [Nocardioides marmotae]QKE02634.1 hypothetical protein HPC71_17310 [Nocardioides marmotae]
MAGLLTTRDVALAVAPGLLSLADPSALSGRGLAAYRLGVAATTVASTVVELDDPDLHAPPAVRWAGGVAVGALLWRTMPRWERADVALHSWLTAHGVPRSRLVVATLSTAAVLALAALERRRPTDDGQPDPGPDHEPDSEQVRDPDPVVG